MKNSKIYWAAIYFLLAIIIVLLLLLLNKQHLVSISSLVKNKDFFDVISKVVGSSAIIVGGILSYYKFFKGRTFSESLKLFVNVKVFSATESQNLHFIDIQLENTGNVTIWEPHIFVDIVYYSDLRKEENIDLIERNSEKDEKGFYKPLIEVTETISNHLNHLVNVSDWLIVYRVKIISKKGNIWERLVSIPNQKDYIHSDR